MTASEPAPIRATIAQLDPERGNVAANCKTICDTLAAAAAVDTDIVVFPELALTGYHIQNDVDALTDRAEQALAEILPHTTDMVVVLGTPTTGPAAPYNAAVVLEDEERVGAYEKTHLYGVEQPTFASGSTYPTFETSIGTIGVEICYDLEFPEVARQLAMNGADLLVTISANMRPCELDQDTYHRARALENAIPHILCNRVGTERGEDYFGASGVVNARGRRVLSVGEDQAVTTTIEIPTGVEFEKAHAYLEDRRPETYSLD